jgi:tetratricopeptide (TPR) repeat protein
LKRIDAEAWNNKGVHLHNLSQYEEATKCFDRALEINPKYASAWDNKGVSLQSLSRYEEALECHNNALEINPQNVGAWYNKSGCLIDLNRYSQALKCCKIALEINPKFTWAWFIKGIVEDQLGLKRDAAASYRRLIELASPRDTKNVEIARGRLRELEKS